MANIKSQKKRNLTNERRRLRNKAVKSALKTYLRRFEQAVASGDRDEATVAMRKASRELDKAMSKGIIHKNNASNHKSAMALQLNSSVKAGHAAS